MDEGELAIGRKSSERSPPERFKSSKIRIAGECRRPVSLEDGEQSEVGFKMRLENCRATMPGRALETRVKSLEFILSAIWRVLTKE